MKNTNKILILIFGTILLLPAISGVFGIGKNLVLDENRELAVMPKIGMYSNFSKLFTNYFSDNFGLRNWLIVADRWMRYKLFNVSPNKAITIGKNNWLFYTPDVNYIDSANAQAFTQGELEQIKTNLLNTQNKFKDKGIKFYFLAAPNKQSIYPEYLPDYMKKIRSDSRLDQLSSFLEKDKEIAFVNPKNELQEMKNIVPVYLKYDTHWNDWGAFVAYQKLFERINQDFKTIQAKNINDFVISQKEAPNNDLAKQMGVGGNFKEISPIFKDKKNNSKVVFEDCPKIYTACPLMIREISNSKLPKLVMFRDSFGTGLIPFITEHFQRSYFYWGSIPLPALVVDKEKPNIVIMELTERELWRLKDGLFTF
jgi:hypothetical protein